jgi:hypothetical protein
MYFNLDFYAYIFVVPLNITYIFCFSLIHYLNHTLKYHVHIFFLNSLSKNHKKWIEDMRENLYV